MLRSVGIDADCKAHLFPSGVEECNEVHAGFTSETVVNGGMDRPHAVAAATLCYNVIMIIMICDSDTSVVIIDYLRHHHLITSHYLI